MAHNIFNSKIYRAWVAMRTRCSNPRIRGAHRYSGRGIKVCKRWNLFENFFKDMNPSLQKTIKKHKKGIISIDRIDNSKGYSNKNCRWATRKQQAINRDTTKLFNGYTLADWAIKIGVKRSTLAQRYYVYGWDIKRVLKK